MVRRPGGLLAVGLAGMLALPAWSAPQQSFGETAVIQEQRIEHRVVLGGTVVPSRQVTISAQMPGTVEFIAGEEGDSFAAQAVLVTLDEDELLAQRRSALAQMANAEAALRNAGVQFTRELVSPNNNRSMPGMGIPSMFDNFFTRGFSDMMGFQDSGMNRHADLISRETHIRQAQSSFLQAQSQLEEIDARLRDTRGFAPFDGVITNKLVEVGDTVQPGMPLLKYADTKFLQISAEIPSRLMRGIREGVIVPARLDVHDAPPIKAKVAQVFPMADTSSHTVTVKFDLPTTAPAAPGMYAEVMVIDTNMTAASVPVVPEAALVRRGSLPAVFVVKDDGSTELRLVRLGERVEEGSIAVLSGLSSGERVVVNPRPGMTSSGARGR